MKCIEMFHGKFIIAEENKADVQMIVIVYIFPGPFSPSRKMRIINEEKQDHFNIWSH